MFTFIFQEKIINYVMTRKFKKNLTSLLKHFDNSEKLLDYLIKNKSFSEEFIKKITNLNREKINIDDIKNLHYEIAYNKRKKKISVDITKNDIFSYLDTDDDLIKKMNIYILNEDYEKALIMKCYFKTIELDY